LKQVILIAGSGKMACNIGEYFLEKGHPVHWITGSVEQQVRLRQRIAKVRRRAEKFFPDHNRQFNGDCHLLTDTDIPVPDIVIESTSESLQKKKVVFSALSPLLTDQTLLFSNSSSLLPDTLHPNCLGAHFFFPVMLTGLIELIIPDTCTKQRCNDSIRFFQQNGYDIFVQKKQNAFLINRLLLPLQAACLQALQEGYPALLVEKASQSELIGWGQLSMMESIGFDLLYAAAANYRDFSETATTVDIDRFLSGLEKLQQRKKERKKTTDSIPLDPDLLWTTNEIRANTYHGLQQHLGDTLRKSCAQALYRHQINLDQLQLVCERIFLAKGFSKAFFAEQADI
jgi:3-hydroxyacyl-CoA dehydrogenase